METIANLKELARTQTQGVIINCGTKWVTSLALVAALRNTDCPVLIIDCDSRDDSKRHFQQLSHRYDLKFHWLSWPLQRHPVALDKLFWNIRSEKVLLIDSDLEVRTRAVYEAMQRGLLSDGDAYGAGFVHGPEWLSGEHGLPPLTAYYQERMWIPFVLLRTAMIRVALQLGLTFNNRRLFFEIPSLPNLSRVLGYRYRIRGLRHIPLWKSNRGDRPEYDGRMPAFVEYDTGADMHAALKLRGHRLVALPTELWGDVAHHHGVTRANLANVARRAVSKLRLSAAYTETTQESVVGIVKERLATVYGITQF